MLKNRNEAYDLLRQLGAPDRLLNHAHVVSQAADELIAEFKGLSVPFDTRIIELGAVLHDAGKIQHPQELSVSGSLHEHAGEALLLSYGVQPEIAHCCTSHGAWDRSDVSFEQRVVALADKLWKGKRVPELELAIIDEVAHRLSTSRWEIFERLDTKFEKIAATGDEKLQLSRQT